MRKERRPWWYLKLLQRWRASQIQRLITPQFDRIGNGLHVNQPKYFVLFGRRICAGDHLHVACSMHSPVELTTWQSKQHKGSIEIGDYCLLSPGVKIQSADAITIGGDCMIGSDTIISDCDWHHTYNRVRPFRCSEPVQIGNNVWIGARAIILKGVSIGENSIVGAGSVVTRNIPANTVFAGNPAKQIKVMNPARKMIKRSDVLSDLPENEQLLMQWSCSNNSSLDYLRSRIFPDRRD